MSADQDTGTTPEAVRCLLHVLFLLRQAGAEAAATAAETRGIGERVLAGDLQDLAIDAHLLLPEGVVPDPDTWVQTTTGADPLALAREAEQLLGLHPLAYFPAGVDAFRARLTEAIGDFS